MIWNDGWYFIKEITSDEQRILDEGQSVKFPHTYYEDGDYFQGDVSYLKVFDGKDFQHKHSYIKFEAVDKVCQIFLNGQFLGEHKGGYSAFALELTDYIKEGTNHLLVHVNNEHGQKVSPLSGDFTLFGGIYRDVHVVIKDQYHFDPTFYGTNGLVVIPNDEEGVGTLRVFPKVKAKEGMQIRYQLKDAQGITIFESLETIEDSTITVPSVNLWDGVDNPYLYVLKAELIEDGKVWDRVSIQTGFRSIAIDAEKGFFLNGNHLKLNGVAKHQDVAVRFSASTPEDQENDMALIKEIGANAIRLSHYQHPSYTYDLCDKNGLVTWAEIPLLKLTDDKDLFENAKEQLKELIYQNAHHPAICFWGLQNEIAIFGEQEYMFKGIDDLHTLAKSLDETRLTTVANLNSVAVDSPLNHNSDVVAYNLYFGWYYGQMPDYGDFFDAFHQANSNVPLAVSEYGVDANPELHSLDPKVKDYTEEFQLTFHETVYPMMLERDYIWGTFIWNMFDFVSAIRNEGGVTARNMKGLVSHDRLNKKDAFYYYKAMWSKEPFVHIAGKRFEKHHEDRLKLKVYSNQPEVTVVAGENSYRVSVENGSAIVSIPFAAEELTIQAIAGDVKDEAVFEKVSEPHQSYIFKDPHAGLNVKNWFEDEVEKEKLFPTGYYSINDTIDSILANEECTILVKEGYPKLYDEITNSIGTFSLDMVCAYRKTLVTEEEMRRLNEELTKIKK